MEVSSEFFSNSINKKLYYRKLSCGLDVIFYPSTYEERTYCGVGVNYGLVDSDYKDLFSDKISNDNDSLAEFLMNLILPKEKIENLEKTGISAESTIDLESTSFLLDFAKSVPFEIALGKLFDFLMFSEFDINDLKIARIQSELDRLNNSFNPLIKLKNNLIRFRR